MSMICILRWSWRFYFTTRRSGWYSLSFIVGGSFSKTNTTLSHQPRISHCTRENIWRCSFRQRVVCHQWATPVAWIPNSYLSLSCPRKCHTATHHTIVSTSIREYGIVISTTNIVSDQIRHTIKSRLTLPLIVVVYYCSWNSCSHWG